MALCQVPVSELIAVRHVCHARLFDCAHPVHAIPPERADLAIKCPRCRKVVGYRLALPRWVPLIEPKPVHCVNPHCLARIADVALAHEYVDAGEADVLFKCRECKAVTALRLSGVGGVRWIKWIK